MSSQRKQQPVAGNGPQETPIEKLREDAASTSATAGAQYVADQQIAEMEAGWLPPPTTADPSAPGVQDLAMGGTGWVAQVGAAQAHIYTQPTASSTVATLAAGAQVSVVEGPVEQGGAAWLRVRTAEGAEGWMNSDELQSG